MDENALRRLLDGVRAGAVTPDEAVAQLRRLPYADLGFARVDHHRALRQGMAEAVYGPGKTPDQCAAIVAELLAAPGDGPVLLTRADPTQVAAALARNPGGTATGGPGVHDPAGPGGSATGGPTGPTAPTSAGGSDGSAGTPTAGPDRPSGTPTGGAGGAVGRADAGGGLATVVWRSVPAGRRPEDVVVVTAGTADLPVADECAATLAAHGIVPARLTDVGVAGVHRLLAVADQLAAADAIVVVAGMEGALASLVGGITAAPVVAVPTSTGYGASFGGITALLGMLASCASGLTVVGIDNGFGAACAVLRMLGPMPARAVASSPVAATEPVEPVTQAHGWSAST